MLYVAIDQHARHLTINTRGEDGEVTVRRQVSTEWKRVRQFFEELRASSQSQGGFMAILEVCGFNDWLLKMLQEYECREIVLIQPETRSKKKTDRRDANQLGELLWVNRQRLLAGRSVKGLRRVRIQTEEERLDRRLTARRRWVGWQLTRLINAVQHLLRRYNIRQECPAKGIQTIKARRWLKELPLKELDRLELDQLLAHWELLDQQLEVLKEQIKKRHALNESSQAIASIPGAGAYTALGLASRVGPVERFPRPRSLANYWGLTPRSRNSGEVTQRLGSITKEGSALARFLLGQLVIHVLRRDVGMRKWYKAIQRRRGSKIARVAVMRRLATIIWHMLTYKVPYVEGGPPRVKLYKEKMAELLPTTMA